MKKILKYIFKLIYNYFILIPMVIVYCLIKFKNKNIHYLIPVNHIGDIIFSLGYLEEYKKKNKIKNVTVVASENKRCIVKLYENSYDFYSIDIKWLNRIFYMHNLNLGFSILNKFKNITIVRPGSYFKSGYKYICKYPSVNLIGIIKYMVYGLNEDCKFNYPKINKCNVDHIIKELKIKKGKTVIINPYAVSTQNIDIKFYEKLVNCLTKKGYDVITNISSDKQDIIKGTKPLVCNLVEALQIANYSGNVVGLRSGFLDLMLFSKCNVVALYPNNDKNFNFFDINAINIENAHQYMITNNIEKDIDLILNYIN